MDSFSYYLLLTHISKEVWKLSTWEAIIHWDDFCKASPSIICILLIDIFHKLWDIFNLPRPIDFKIWRNTDQVFFSFISVRALTSNCGMMQLRNRVSAVQQPGKPCHANALVKNYKMAVVGAAGCYHLFGMASLSDSSNRVQHLASVWNRLRNLLMVSRETDQRTEEALGNFRWKVLRRSLVSICLRKESAYATFTQGLRVPSISP